MCDCFNIVSHIDLTLYILLGHLCFKYFYEKHVLEI